jgi:hypothetical protein
MMYQLILLTMLVTNGKLELHQTKLETFYTATECERFKTVVEKNTLMKLNSNTTNAAIAFECRREI